MIENGDRIEGDIGLPFRFHRRPMPIAAELRPDWKIATLLLILDLSSRGGKSSLKRLHILNWAIRSPQFRAEFEDARANPMPLFGFNVRFEPAFSRAIDFAVGERLVEWVGGNRLGITPKGRRWIKEIERNEELMDSERKFLIGIGKSVTEPVAERLLGSKRSW